MPAKKKESEHNNVDKHEEKSVSSDDEFRQNKQENTQDPTKKSFRKPRNSITNFKFGEVLNLEIIKDTSTTTLLQHLVARSKVGGQDELYRVLYQTLKATNHECGFPKTYNYNKPYRNKTYGGNQTS